MKVRYKTDYTDEHGYFFPAGCVAEHAESDAKARIALGVAEEAPADAYSRIQPPDKPVSLECVVAPEAEPMGKTAKK